MILIMSAGSGRIIRLPVNSASRSCCTQSGRRLSRARPEVFSSKEVSQEHLQGTPRLRQRVGRTTNDCKMGITWRSLPLQRTGFHRGRINHFRSLMLRAEFIHRLQVLYRIIFLNNKHFFRRIDDKKYVLITLVDT